MDDLMNAEKNEEKAEIVFHQMMENGDFQMIAIPSNKIDFRDFSKPELSPTHKTQINALLQQLPSAFAAGTMATAYRVEFPKGITGTLMELKQGGFSTTIIGPDKKFAGTASLYSMRMEAAVLGAFTAMSVITGQFFLARINAELRMINEKIGQILQFLYEDKKAELISEISFVKYASENFSSIMLHDEQRTATISGLQEARKVAMKDIQFYLNDLDKLSKKEPAKKFAEIRETTVSALQIKDSLELSMQLYMMSSLLEIYYAQNFDADFVRYVKEDVNNYLDMCKSNMLSRFASVETGIKVYKPYASDRVEFNECIQKIENLNKILDTYGFDHRKYIQETLLLLNQKSEYYLTADGDVYFKAS